MLSLLRSTLLVAQFVCIINYGLTAEDKPRELGGDTTLVKDGPATAGQKKLPNILFKKQKYVTNSDNLLDQIKLDPPECVYSKFLAPFASELVFPSKDQAKEVAKSSKCTFNFFGTEVCTPKLSCPKFSLPEDCSIANLTVTDGYTGKETFCGSRGPDGIVASHALRDLYIELNGGDLNLDISCKITCTHRGEGHHLEETVAPKVNKKCKCGMKASDNRIVNGVDAKKTEFPWIVAIVEANTRQPFCGASVINNRFVITAAHCFKGKYMDYRRVQLLAQTELLDQMPNSAVLKDKPTPKVYPPDVLAQLDKSNGTVRLDIEEIFVHPLYVSETNDYDVAIVKTVQTIDTADPTQAPACLPPLGSYSLTYAHKDAIVAGWGLPGSDANGTMEQLQKLNVSIFSPRLCKESYVHRVNKRMMCAGYKEGGKDSCMGDSGGPLIVETASKVWTQVGTVSWGEGCALADNPGVYYRTTETGQWFHHISNKNDATWCDSPPKGRH